VRFASRRSANQGHGARGRSLAGCACPNPASGARVDAGGNRRACWHRACHLSGLQETGQLSLARLSSLPSSTDSGWDSSARWGSGHPDWRSGALSSGFAPAPTPSARGRGREGDKGGEAHLTTVGRISNSPPQDTCAFSYTISPTGPLKRCARAGLLWA
jgi:hypothetical protein